MTDCFRCGAGGGGAADGGRRLRLRPLRFGLAVDSGS